MNREINRRQLLLGIVGAGGAVVGGHGHIRCREEHPAHPVAPPDAVAMLYDNTICTGCRACMTACSEANGLPPDTAEGMPLDTSLTSGLWDMPADLNAKTKNIIKLYREPDGTGFGFVKRQCMHCLDPACVTGCPFGALKKEPVGCCHVGEFALHRMPLLRSGLPLRGAEVPVGQVESQDRQVRVLLRTTPEEERGARLHCGVPHGGSDLRET